MRNNSRSLTLRVGQCEDDDARLGESSYVDVTLVLYERCLSMALRSASHILIKLCAVSVCAASMSLCDFGLADEAAPESKPAVEKSSKKPEPRKELFAGTVVLLQDALKKRDIKVADEMKLQAVLETKSGELIPIAADWRGRAFFQDKKLRNRPVEIVGYRRPGVPYLQALVVYFFNKKGEREEFDYWCDICAIPMYEIKDCECCQGPSRHRYRLAKLPDYLFRKDTAKKPSPKVQARPTDKPSSAKKLAP